MNRVHHPLARFSAWLSFERYGLAAQAFYGAFVLCFDSFQKSLPWGSLVAVTKYPELLFACILFSGSMIQTYGLWREHNAYRMWGALCGFSAFFIALVSQLAAVPAGTGVPIYGIASGFYLILALRRAFHAEWVSIRL